MGAGGQAAGEETLVAVVADDVTVAGEPGGDVREPVDAFSELEERGLAARVIGQDPASSRITVRRPLSLVRRNGGAVPRIGRRNVRFSA